MKKKKVKKLVLIISTLAVAVLLSYIIISQNKNIHRLAEIYNKIENTETYSFEMERNKDNKVVMVKNGDKTIIDHYSGDNHSSTIVKDGYTYLVLHNREEYYVYEPQNIEQNLLIDGLKEIKDKTYYTGSERIKGKRFYYEEYEGSTIFIISTSMDISEENTKTRFFFDNDGNLAYIKTIAGDNQELLKVNLQFEVDDSIFEIPSNYAEN